MITKLSPPDKYKNKINKIGNPHYVHCCKVKYSIKSFVYVKIQIRTVGLVAKLVDGSYQKNSLCDISLDIDKTTSIVYRHGL